MANLWHLRAVPVDCLTPHPQVPEGWADQVKAAQVLDSAVVSPRASPSKSWLAKLIWSRPLDPLWLSSSAGRNSLTCEDLVEGLRDELFNLRFRQTDYRNLAAALAQPRNVGLSRNRMLKTESSRRSIA
jgi:hypothetical protein